MASATKLKRRFFGMPEKLVTTNSLEKPPPSTITGRVTLVRPTRADSGSGGMNEPSEFA